MPLGNRRRAREAALQVLYALDLRESLDPEVVEGTFDEIALEFELPVRARERALALALGVSVNRKRIDEALTAASEHWRLERMAAVERNILRIGAYELLFEPQTPVEVAIDEAIEVCQRFAGDAAPSFVNGVLDRVARERERGGGAEGPGAAS